MSSDSQNVIKDVKQVSNFFADINKEYDAGFIDEKTMQDLLDKAIDIGYMEPDNDTIVRCGLELDCKIRKHDKSTKLAAIKFTTKTLDQQMKFHNNRDTLTRADLVTRIFGLPEGSKFYYCDSAKPIVVKPHENEIVFKYPLNLAAAVFNFPTVVDKFGKQIDFQYDAIFIMDLELRDKFMYHTSKAFVFKLHDRLPSMVLYRGQITMSALRNFVF